MSDSDSQDAGKTPRKPRKPRKSAIVPDTPSDPKDKPKTIRPSKKTVEDSLPISHEEKSPKSTARRRTAAEILAEEANATDKKKSSPKKTDVKKSADPEVVTEIQAADSPKKSPRKTAPRKHQEEVSAPILSEETDGKTRPLVKRTTIKRTSSRPEEQMERSAENGSSHVVERVSSLTDNSPVDALPTKTAQLAPEDQNQRNGNNGNNRHQNKNNRFQNRNNNNRQNNNGKNNRFNKNRNARNGGGNRQESYQEHVALEETGTIFETNGLLEFAPKGYAFLRTQDNDFDQSTGGVYVSPEIIKKYALRHCQWIHGMAINTNRGVQLREIISVNDVAPEESKKLPHFEDLKAHNPDKRFSLETIPERYTTRVVDMMAPIGRGQRGLIVAPPRTGKTILLQHIAEALVEKYEEEVHLMILLIDERPEEVTEFKRGIKGAEVYASSNDGRVRDHCRLAELCIERAKRLVESGRHVFILMDSITRLARAYNNAFTGSGRTMSGGIDARALEMPRRLFASARNTKEAGSLTIIATALIETNSRMDDLIFQEFKGTGNMELVLNRRIAEQYIYPAVDILKSGTRREELILPELVLEKVNLIRRALAGHRPVEAMERLLYFLRKYPNNAQMLIDLKQRA